jgi:Protein of unknown function (DUF3723)
VISPLGFIFVSLNWLKMDDYASSVTDSMIGTVRIDISCLAFEDKSRAEDQDIVDYLLSVYKGSRHGCEQDNADHQIPAVVDSREMDHILENSQLTRDDLRRLNLDGEYPKINASNAKIRCVRGMHRVKAAEEFLKERDPENCWWVIKLFTFNIRSE